ncbi:DNA gyrase/topoisomerase IV, A subunit [Capnocytophaga ochracea F0287]|uniref:DNA gyrase/topoisomerase IV, A subunit n=1 Tax=Capnocytophaga ochracea F0287 TaxID=873517 RepID=E4MSJ2_CAPOC|nr:DNA gyrase/topoisomerase IV subunit A [Capnocytophaga ochracea]EFS97382.1 DNA gyrase/topoisomerase IV, A subunit [Capnocytophaga ochracea F0287]EJF43521.1 DNA gyrase/topoisomerase IV, A subunit [Capnocytophaga ochracea str. Holt 25]UEB44322.1 DNA gyrase/topoisomerase IV subunit A [Capnocytophaga ochracea]
MEDNTPQNTTPQGDSIIKVTGMYQDWFLDYASYVILERAVPAIEDGFKPVQRRIMHSLKELDDGRYNKVANVVGNTMQYHPHGDASIGDAIVQIGQKDLLIDTQGNWGNILTGDDAAAPRYIEARLSKFALDVVFSPKVTEWQSSYDGRKKEPISLPVKFPLLLAQGTEGIAVGLSTKILPHNFIELIEASIAYLKKKPFELYPDFPTAGIMDVSGYNDGARGGRVRVRAKISQLDKSTLCITEIPFTTTTTSLIDSILKANEKGKIKIKKVDDNTAANVEILVHLPNGTSPDKTIDALYAFTACETAISPITCVIEDNKPHFLTVSEVLRRSTDRTVSLLKQELEIELSELEMQWHSASLEKIFIREEMYIDFKNYTDRESLYEYLYQRFEPFKKDLIREITDDDLAKLTQIPMIRITRFDSYKADENILKIEADIEEVKNHLANLIDYAISHFERLKKTYGKGRERKTEMRVFDTIEATKVVVRNTKLYVNRAEGFVGTGLRKDEYVGDCSDIDDVIVFTESGAMYVTKVSDKQYIEKNIIHVAVFKKDDKRTVYNMIYKDGQTGFSYIKRFNVTGITRDKKYELIPQHKESRVLYFTANPNGEAEVVTVNLRQLGTLRKLRWDIDFADTLIKGRGVKGNLVSKYAIKRIELKEKGVSTLKPRKIWFDDIVKRLNTEERGTLLGAFKGDDRMLLITKEGVVKTIIPELSLHFENNIAVMEKWVPEKPISVIYYDGEKERVFVKRFVVENENREELVITEHPKSQLLFVSADWRPMAEVVFTKEKGKEKENLTVNLEEFISVKGIKALGNQLTTDKVKTINTLESLPYEEPQEEEPVEDLGDEEIVPPPSENESDGTQTELEF